METNAKRKWSWRGGVLGATFGLFVGSLLVFGNLKSRSLEVERPAKAGRAKKAEGSAAEKGSAAQKSEFGEYDNAASLLQQIAAAKYQTGDVDGAVQTLSQIMDKRHILKTLERLLDVHPGKGPFYYDEPDSEPAVNTDRVNKIKKHKAFAKKTLETVLAALRNGEFQFPFVAPDPTPDFPAAKPKTGVKAQILFQAAKIYEAIEMPEEAKSAINEAAKNAAEYHKSEVLRDQAWEAFFADREAELEKAEARTELRKSSAADSQSWGWFIMAGSTIFCFVGGGLSKPLIEAFSKGVLGPAIATAFDIPGLANA